MKRYLVGVLLAVFAVSAGAANVKATVAAGTAQCGYILDSGAVVLVPASGTTCLLDVGSVATGAHVVSADARAAPDPIWGSPPPTAQSTPLNFSRPVPLVLTVPTGLVLVP